jgi:hypothetical protein
MEQGWFTWDASWTWGITLIACTVAMHVSWVVIVAAGLRNFAIAETRRKRRFFNSRAGSICIIVAVAWLLAIAHGVECAVWSTLYLHLGAITTPADAALYSIDSMTTRGSSGIVFQHRWLMLGAIESINGLLLFGISTAFLYHVLRSLLPEVTTRAA